MPGIRCAVAGYNNSFVDCKKTGRDLSFFRFPSHKDFVSSTIREEWIKRCHKSKTFNAENHRVCSVHFTETDFERDLENELLGKPLRKILKKTAFPTLCLPINVPSTSNATPMPSLVESSNIPFEEHSEAPDYKTLYEELSVKYGTLNQRFLEHKKKSLLRIKKMNDTIKYWKNKSFSNKSVNRKDVTTMNFRNLQTKETKKNTFKRESVKKSDFQRAKMRKLNKIVDY